MESARGIISGIPPFVGKTGVFVDKDAGQILETVEKTGIDTIQLHGESSLYDRAFIENLSLKCPFPIILAVRKEIVDEKTVAELMNERYHGLSAWMIDGVSPDKYGGTGKSPVWREIAEKNTARFLKTRVIIAGGVNISNVGSLLEKMLPYGIDISSGLEKERGIKDKSLIKKFMEHMREISPLNKISDEAALY